MIYKAQGDANQTIADRLDININTVNLCLNKYKSGGIQEAIFDKQRKGRPVEITDDSVSWIIHIACQRPADLGYSQELWTLKNLHAHVQIHAAEATWLMAESGRKLFQQDDKTNAERHPGSIQTGT